MEDIFTPELDHERGIIGANNYCRDGLLDIKISTSSAFPLSAYTRIRSSFKTENTSLLNSQTNVKTEIGFKKYSTDKHSSFLGNFSNEGDFNFLFSNFQKKKEDDTLFYGKISKGIYRKVPRFDFGFFASYNEMLVSDNFSLNFKGKTEFTVKDGTFEALRMENEYKSDYDLETVFNLSDIWIKRNSFVRLKGQKELKEGEEKEETDGEKEVVKKVGELDNRFGVSFELKYNMTNFWDNTLRIDEISLWYLQRKIKCWLKYKSESKLGTDSRFLQASFYHRIDDSTGCVFKARHNFSEIKNELKFGLDYTINKNCGVKMMLDENFQANFNIRYGLFGGGLKLNVCPNFCIVGTNNGYDDKIGFKLSVNE